MPYKDPERKRQYHREYQRMLRKLHPEARKAAGRERKAIMKALVIKEYGGKCRCCGEHRPEFLTVNHILGNGRQHRNSIRIGMVGGSSDFYYWLKKQGFPKGDFELLCISCNFSLGMYGYCPHDRERAKREAMSLDLAALAQLSHAQLAEVGGVN